MNLPCYTDFCIDSQHKCVVKVRNLQHSHILCDVMETYLTVYPYLTTRF